MPRTAQAGGSANGATVLIVNHDVPSDPVAMAAARKAQAQRDVEAAEAAVARAQAHYDAATTRDKQDRQAAHLAAAAEALALAQKGLG